MKERVSLLAVPGYERSAMEDALSRLLAPLGGMGAFVRPGQKVLLKPNMLAGKAPEKAVTTHPELVRGVIRLVQEAGGIVSVGDSPGLGSPRHVAGRSGILDVIEETGARFAPFDESVRIRSGGGTFQELELARDVLEADVVINLPKLKTHQMMGMTCAVKNLFGAVVGMRKIRLHLQAGTDKAFFALMLLEIAERVRPALSIVDAVVGMEGNGPGSGDPVQIGALLAGTDPLAVDIAATELLGLRPDAVWTLKVARERRELPEVESVGAEPKALRPRSFRPAKSTDVNFGLPPILKNPLRRHLTAMPEADPERCELCGLCVKHCPPQAMQIDRGHLLIDTRRCIGCFCCQELCPHGAILTRQGLLLRLARFLGGR
ncbi:MAG: (4Fe-4S)-binding protein [Desulfuromonas sp.]|uniref:DUF362 domain-containing protein n=1 Tax=Desulfuromonas sp. TaxID=892 RepID=UPI000CA7EB8F|nr:DUF362 domain-containing protein [Desulfuromonas sp.]PLX84599.1 MAG: (4Fe-4S)-binding protein [Desulfuromonas sp.]